MIKQANKNKRLIVPHAVFTNAVVNVLTSLTAMFNGQILFDRAMSVRMDKMADQNQPVAAPRLPSKYLIENGMPRIV